MNRTLLAASILCLAVTGCSESTKVSDDLADSSDYLDNPTGRAERVVSGALPVLSAPFDSAEKIDSLSPGQTVYVCTRSHDQQWFGIVYDKQSAGATEADSSVDCGVSSPVRAKRNYDGPCKSGWVESLFVVLVAG